MPPTYFPLRWESTGDQWWYASPIDCAAANGHYDLVRELLRLDGNHLIKLASLRRIRRLESVWDDDEHFDDVARNRSQVAQKIFSECETKRGKNSLIQGGYGGWLLYTAASAGDLVFVQELLGRYPLLVFGEGEYGVTDILYAAARSKSSEVFRLLLDFAISPRFFTGNGKEVEEHIGEIPSAYKKEMMNRALHAAARGGNLMVLKELLGDCSDVLAYRDIQGSTILHAAAGRGQVEVVKDLITSFDIINSSDNKGNTALHVAAYRGQLAVVEALILGSPSCIYSRNNTGETFLHTAVNGFQTPIFRRLDRQVELMKQLVRGKVFNIEEIINAKNNVGRSALQMAIAGNIHSDLVELLMTVRSIDVNVRDINGMTPLDLLKQRPCSATSEILTRQLVSAGGIFSCQDYSARKVIASHIRMRSIGSSPGTSFKIPDSEIFLCTGIENPAAPGGSARLSTADSAGLCKTELVMENHSTTKPGNDAAALGLKRFLLRWPKMKRKPETTLKKKKTEICEGTPLPLRQRYSSLANNNNNNKRTLSVRSNVPSPTAKKEFASGLVHGVMQQAMPPHMNRHRSRSSSFSKSSNKSSSNNSSSDKQKGINLYAENDASEASCSYQSTDIKDETTENVVQKPSGFVNKRLLNQFCFGASGLPAKAQAAAACEGQYQQQEHQIYGQSVLSIA